IRNATKVPIMLVTGTGATGEQAYAIGKDGFDAYGHPVCDVDFPNFTTADIQRSVQYLVYGIRREAWLADRKVAVFGISQGGLLPRFALTYWPGLRSKVSDVISAAGTQHGSTIAIDGRCSAAEPCVPAAWQQAAGSHLLRALNRQPDETPGKLGWTTVRSSGDETVQPQIDPHPTSALRGATNILIQRVCPGRKVSHIGTALDSVTFAAFVDGITHRGPAKVSRLPAGVCDHPYAPGLDETTTDALLGASGGLVSAQIAASPKVGAEPPVRAYVKRLP
ncbi:MAG: esterase/lipase family protein, partial [Solirubrobacterales bacterium]